MAYGWTDAEIASLDQSKAEKYERVAEALQARERLMDLKIADYPHMKTGPKRKVYDAIRRVAYPKVESLTPTAPITTTELAARLRTHLGGKR